MKKDGDAKHNGKGEPKEPAEAPADLPKCFMIMPISDPEGYEKGHFKRVYHDIFKPACAMAGYEAVRADEHNDTGMIHFDILRRLIDSPLAICDLSTRNPNVLYELGLRHAFDKPTVLVQEVGTQRIFDVTLLRTIEYRKELKYWQVLEDQKLVEKTIRATVEEAGLGRGMSSLVRLLELHGPAKLKDGDGSPAEMLKVVLAELSRMRSDMNDTRRMVQKHRPWSPTPKNITSGGRVVEDYYLPDRIAKKAKSLLADAKRMKDEGYEKEAIVARVREAKEVIEDLIRAGGASASEKDIKGLVMAAEILLDDVS